MTKLGLDYPTAWGRSFLAGLARNLFHISYMVPYVRHVGSLKVEGLEYLGGKGPFIFVANHTSNLDTPIFISALPPRIRKRLVVAAAMDNFFMDKKKARRTVIMFNAIPIDRHRVNRRSAEQAFDLIEAGWSLLLYPEGGRSPDGDLKAFKGGAAYLAERTKATVVPTYIHEAGLLQGSKWAKAPKFVNAPYQRRHPVSVTFGEPLICGDEENIRRFSVRIEDAVIGLGRRVSGNAEYGFRPDDAY